MILNLNLIHILFTIHFATINTIYIDEIIFNVTDLQYTLLLLIRNPYVESDA